MGEISKMLLKKKFYLVHFYVNLNFSQLDTYQTRYTTQNKTNLFSNRFQIRGCCRAFSGVVSTICSWQSGSFKSIFRQNRRYLSSLPQTPTPKNSCMSQNTRKLQMVTKNILKNWHNRQQCYLLCIFQLKMFDQILILCV